MRAAMRRDLFISSAKAWTNTTVPRTVPCAGSETSRNRSPAPLETNAPDWMTGPAGFIEPVEEMKAMSTLRRPRIPLVVSATVAAFAAGCSAPAAVIEESEAETKVALQDFPTRCVQPGVIKCVGFDVAADFDTGNGRPG